MWRIQDGGWPTWQWKEATGKEISFYSSRKQLWLSGRWLVKDGVCLEIWLAVPVLANHFSSFHFDRFETPDELTGFHAGIRVFCIGVLADRCWRVLVSCSSLGEKDAEYWIGVHSDRCKSRADAFVSLAWSFQCESLATVDSTDTPCLQYWITPSIMEFVWSTCFQEVVVVTILGNRMSLI